jgi:hypothetical protein
VGLTGLLPNNVHHRYIANQQSIADQRAMTAPGYRFCTHDDRLLICSQQDEPVDTPLEFRRLHVIGKAAEGGIPPGGVHGCFSCAPQSAKFFEAEIIDVRLI